MVLDIYSHVLVPCSIEMVKSKPQPKIPASQPQHNAHSQCHYYLVPVHRYYCAIKGKNYDNSPRRICYTRDQFSIPYLSDHRTPQTYANISNGGNSFGK